MQKEKRKKEKKNKGKGWRHCQRPARMKRVPARPDVFSRQTPHPRPPDPARPGPVWRSRPSYGPSAQSRRPYKEAYVFCRLSAPLPTLSQRSQRVTRRAPRPRPTHRPQNRLSFSSPQWTRCAMSIFHNHRRLHLLRVPGKKGPVQTPTTTMIQTWILILTWR